MLDGCAQVIYSRSFVYAPFEFMAIRQLLDSQPPLLKNDTLFTSSCSASHCCNYSQTVIGTDAAQPQSFACVQVSNCNYLAPKFQCCDCQEQTEARKSRNKIVSNADSFRQKGTFDYVLNMLDSTTYANGNQSVVIAVTTSEPAIVNAVKKSECAQPTSLLLSNGRSPKIVVISVPATHEAQIPRAFLPPPVDVSSRKATNSVDQESFKVKVLEYDIKQRMERAEPPNIKPDSSIITSFNGIQTNMIADQHSPLRSLNTCLLDIIFGVSPYLILLHFLIHTLFSYLIWSTEAQIHKHQKLMNKNNQNIKLIVCILVISSLFGIFNVSAINDITQDNGIGTGKGAVINAQLYQGSILKVIESCAFYNCSTQQNDNCAGGAINTVVNGSNSQFIVSDLVKFEKCQSKQGGAISVELLNMGICVVNNVKFNECSVNNDGGGIYAQLQNSGGTLTVTNHTSFVQCNNTDWGGGGMNIVSYGSNSKCIISDNVIFEKCEAGIGGAIYLDRRDGASFEVHNCQFVECTSRYYGGAIYYQSLNNNNIPSFILDGVSFISCSSQYNSGNGGSLSITVFSGTSTINGSLFSGCQSLNNGGAINIDLYSNSALIIDNGIFTDCGCLGPGRGGAIAIYQQQSNCLISITNSSFTNCKTLSGISNQYGWGGAIVIKMELQASQLNATNFILSDLSFTNCKASCAGNNLHILSPDTLATGQAIKNGNLLTVKDPSIPPNIISDLYTSPQYAYDYMGINQSIEINNPGTINLDLHNHLFEKFLTSNVPNPSYIDAINGKDIKFCGWQSSMCKTIKYSIERNPTPLSGTLPTDSIYTIILTSNTALDTNIQITSTTLVNGYVVIKSDEYNPNEDYTKQSILTSSFNTSLFTISGSGHLELLGLHFDNLNPSSNNPIISLLSDDYEQNLYLSIIDCEFNQDPDSYSHTNLSHSLISINRGIIRMERAKIESYQLMNDNSLINIKQGAEEIFILNCNIRNILKIGEKNLGIIELYKSIKVSNEEQQMNVRIELCSFIQPISTSSSNITTSSPFIHASIGKLEIISCSFGSEDESSQLWAHAISIEAECTQLIISNTNFTKLLSGGILLKVGQDSVALIEDCLFMNCGDGSQIAGAAHTTGVTGYNLGSISITNSQFISCQGQQAGGIVFGDNIIPLNVKNNYFSKNIISNLKGVKDILFSSKEMLNEAEGIEVVAEGYKYDKTDGYVGEVKISGFDANFAQYLDCKTEGREDCGEIPCGGTKEQTEESCKETIKEEEEKEEEINDKKKLSREVIAGIIIGAVVVIVAILVIIVIIVIYKKV
ncbi:MAG: hypothetical protein EZS28_000491 [Streblomastix strix]|uniref:Right handed beta helix domain-containing protein n=1 Tax=Streblomastix strix TaxID=222440 RepID=A0A5J4X9K4_9EUKA|nr:MAG: hypothetical protein EZS28_000491 [Streblomastix strix]